MFGSGHSTAFPAEMYLALFTTTPTDAGGGVEVGDTGTNYARAQLANNDTFWQAASGGSKTNGILLQFNQATDDWGQVTAWAIMTEVTGGSIVVYGELAVAKTIATGMAPFFDVGTLIVTCD